MDLDLFLITYDLGHFFKSFDQNLVKLNQNLSKSIKKDWKLVEINQKLTSYLNQNPIMTSDFELDGPIQFVTP